MVTRSPSIQTVGLPSGASSSENLPKNGRTSPHDDRYQIDGHLVDQPRFQTLPSQSPGRDCDNTAAGDLLCPRDGGLDAGGGEGERSVWMGVDPVGRNIVGDDHDQHVHGVPPAPAVGEVEQRSAADQRTELGGPLAQVLGASGVRWNVITGVAVGNSTSPL